MPWLFFKKTKIERSPAKIISLISGVTTVPYFFILAFFPGYESPILNLINGDLGELQIIFAIYYSLGLLAMYWGIKIGGIKFNNGIVYKLQRYSDVSSKRIHLILFFMAISLILAKLQLAGGLFFLLENIRSRGELLAGTGFIDLFLIPAAFFSIFYAIYNRSMTGKPKAIEIIIMIIILSVLLSLFGGRKLPMMLIILAILAAIFYDEKLKIYSIRFLPVYILIIFFFATALEHRINEQLGVGAQGLNFYDYIRNASYLETYLFILDHFSVNDFWYGVGHLDLVYRIIPFFSESLKPPIDDGVYIRTLAEGIFVKPPVSFEDMYPSSWPPETFGSGYMNFGLIGVILYFLLKGFISGLVFSYAKSKKFQPIPLFLFFYVVINFHVSNLRVFQVGMLVVFLIAIKYVSSLKNIAAILNR